MGIEQRVELTKTRYLILFSRARDWNESARREYINKYRPSFSLSLSLSLSCYITNQQMRPVCAVTPTRKTGQAFFFFVFSPFLSFLFPYPCLLSFSLSLFVRINLFFRRPKRIQRRERDRDVVEFVDTHTHTPFSLFALSP